MKRVLIEASALPSVAKSCAASLAIAIAVLLFCAAPSTAEDATATATAVLAEDIYAGRAKIIGFLGQPLGEVMTIRVEIVAPIKTAKATSPHFRITHRNGVELDPPLEMEPFWLTPVSREGRSGTTDKDRWDWKAHWGGKVSSPKWAAGDVWEMRGVEACQTHVPIAVWDERGPFVQEPPGPGAAGFFTTFEYFAMRRLARGKESSPPAKPRAAEKP